MLTAETFANIDRAEAWVRQGTASTLEDLRWGLGRIHEKKLVRDLGNKDANACHEIYLAC